MKHINFLRVIAITLVAAFSIGTAQAALIDGILKFGGEVTPTGSGTGDATGLEFVSGIVVTDGTGDFAANGVGFGDTGTIADFLFAAPASPFLTVGGFSFAMDTVQIITQDIIFLVLTGTGTLSGPGLMDTLYDFSLSVDGTPGAYAFSGTLAPSAIPVPGALLLFMSGLAALGVRRRG